MRRIYHKPVFVDELKEACKSTLDGIVCIVPWMFFVIWILMSIFIVIFGISGEISRIFILVGLIGTIIGIISMQIYAKYIDHIRKLVSEL